MKTHNQRLFYTDKTRYFLDMEFLEYDDQGKQRITPVSLGMVSEDGAREYYGVNRDADLSKANAWVREHVVPQLPAAGDAAWKSMAQIREDVLAFVDPKTYGMPEFWGYYADYDWVLFCALFGRMIDLPKDYPMFCMDLKQLSVEVGDPKHPEQTSGEHNALGDARWNRELFQFLQAYKPPRASVPEAETEEVFATWQLFASKNMDDKESELLLARWGWEIVLGRRPPEHPKMHYHLRPLDDAGVTELVRALGGDGPTE